MEKYIFIVSSRWHLKYSPLNGMECNHYPTHGAWWGTCERVRVAIGCRYKATSILMHFAMYVCLTAERLFPRYPETRNWEIFAFPHVSVQLLRAASLFLLVRRQGSKTKNPEARHFSPRFEWNLRKICRIEINVHNCQLQVRTRCNRQRRRRWRQQSYLWKYARECTIYKQMRIMRKIGFAVSVARALARSQTA